MSVLHTIAELIEVFGATYRAIDVRGVAIRGNDTWVNVMCVVRLTYEDVATASERIARLSKRFPAVYTKSLRIDMTVRPFSDWDALCSEVKNDGILHFGSCEFRLRQRPDLLAAGGYFQPGYSDIRSFDGRAWPALRISFDPGGTNPLTTGRFIKEAHLLGYADVFEAANALCEVNVSPQNNGADFLICVPVFATIKGVRVNTKAERVEVDIERHNSLSDLKAVVCLREQTTRIDEPFQQQRNISEFTSDTEGEIVHASAHVQIEPLKTDGWLQIRLYHPGIGEIKRDENYAHMFIPAAERNILLEALRLFCSDAELDGLLTRAYDAKPPRLNESAGFEIHVAWLLGLFGFSTIVLGQYEHISAPRTKVRRATVDILAANQKQQCLIIAACTLNAPKSEDFGTIRYARDILAREVFAGTRIQIIPVVLTSATGCPSYEMAEGSLEAVAIMDADRIRNALTVLRTGMRPSIADFLSA